MSGRTLTPEYALQQLRSRGVIAFGKELKPGHSLQLLGNRSWGCIDYLTRQHGYIVSPELYSELKEVLRNVGRVQSA